MKALVKITAAMAAAVIPAGITASAASETNSVSYLRLVNGSFKSEEITDLWGVEISFSADHEWYYVSGSVTFPERLVVYGGKTVNLVLGDNFTFNCPKGIYVSPDVGAPGTLNIYSQSTGENMGTLNCGAVDKDAAIGGNRSTKNRTVNIYGGNINANGGRYAAGIGTGDEAKTGWDNQINIFGGNVNANGGEKGAGIGTGDKSDSAKPPVHIYGGRVTGRGGKSAAGIGGGAESNSPGKVIINGGTVYAKSVKKPDCGYMSRQGTGIGSGSASSYINKYGNFTGEITVNGGEVIAEGGGNYYNENHCSGAGIGSGCGGYMEGTINLNGGNVKAISHCGEAAVGSGNSKNLFTAGAKCTGTKNINGGTVIGQVLDSVPHVKMSEFNMPQVFGHGFGGRHEAPLNIYEGAEVLKGAAMMDAVRVPAAEQKAACQSLEIAPSKYVKISPIKEYEYKINAADSEQGLIHLNNDRAKTGEEVTVYAMPNGGYELEAILVDGVRIKGNTFKMPAHNVTVSDEYYECPF